MFAKGYPPKYKRHAEHHQQSVQLIQEAAPQEVTWEPVQLAALGPGCTYCT